jgi:hypothetical protein
LVHAENEDLKESKAFREIRAQKATLVHKGIKAQKATRETRVSLATLL